MTHPLLHDYEVREVANSDAADAAAMADRQAILTLVSEMWGEDVTARVDWLYERNPHGRARTWLVIEKATREAVACTSIFPRKVFVDGQERAGSIGGDCYVLPRARRRGIATLLHQVSLREMRGRGIDFMYGPPNPNNLLSLLKAGARQVTTFKRFVRPLTGGHIYRAAFDKEPSQFEARLADLPLAILDRFTKVDAHGLALEPVERFDEESDWLFERVSQRRGIYPERGSRYLQWRYLDAVSQRQRPLAIRRDGEMVGFSALETQGEAAAIIDLFTLDEEGLMEKALQLLMNNVAGAGCSSLEMSCTSDGAFPARLRRLGFVGRSERGFQVAAYDDDAQLRTLLDASAWNFTAADQDMDSFFTAAPQ